MMVKLQVVLLICLITLVSICPARRTCREKGGRCVKSLTDYPCSDPNGSVLTPRGWPLCRKDRYCCVASPGVLCFPNPSIYGPKSFCMLPGSDPEYPLSCTSPNGTTPYGLRMKFGDNKCKQIVNNTACCTVVNQCSANPSGYCGPKYVLHNLEESCRNGIHYPAGDGACTDESAPFCCLATKQECGPEATCKPMCGLSYQYPLGDVLCDESTKCCTDEPRTTPTKSTDYTSGLPTTAPSGLTTTESGDLPPSSSTSYTSYTTSTSSSSSFSSSSENIDGPKTAFTSAFSSYEESSSMPTVKTTQRKTTQAGGSSSVTQKPIITGSSSANDPATTKRPLIPIRPL